MKVSKKNAQEDIRARLRSHRTLKLWVIWLLVLVILIMPVVLPPLEEPHILWEMTDVRTAFGVSNFWNVISNVPLLIVGAWGLCLIWRRAPNRQTFISCMERWPYLVFFLSVTLTAVGSAYFHLDPNSARLFWDRLPISFGIMSLLSAIITDRISAKIGLILLIPLLLVGAGTVFYWRWTDLQGAENLVPYASMQYGSIILIIAIACLFHSRYSRGADVLTVLAIYALAKVAELFDAVIYAFGQMISGHTLKHLLASIAVWWLLRMLQLRCPQQVSRSDPTI